MNIDQERAPATSEISADALRSGSMSFEEAQRIAGCFLQSGFFSDTTDIAQATVKVMAGVEMGIAPFAAMTGLHIVKGKVVVGADILAKAVRRAGYNFRAEIEHDACIITFFDPTGNEIGKSSFTKADAHQAGLADRDNWKKFGRNMYFARAMSNGVRWFCPEVVGATAYVPDEIDPVPVGAEQIQDGGSREKQKEAAEQQRLAAIKKVGAAEFLNAEGDGLTIDEVVEACQQPGDVDRFNEYLKRYVGIESDIEVETYLSGVKGTAVQLVARAKQWCADHPDTRLKPAAETLGQMELGG